MYWIKLGRGELDDFNLSRLLHHIDRDDGFLHHFCVVTGDGHAHPSFGWIDKVEKRFRDHILDMVKHDVLCAHVEKLNTRVTHGDLPAALRPVHDHGKLFGWELPIFEHIELLMQEILTVASDDTLQPTGYRAALRMFDRHLTTVFGYSTSIDKTDLFRARIREFEPHHVRDWLPDDLKMRLMAFNTELMGLRTDPDVHRATANGIHARMIQNKNHSHLISIGNAHLIHNNFCRYLDNANTGVVVGIVDIYTGGADMVF